MTASSDVTCKSKDISKLLAKCEKLVEQYQYDLALQFCDRILSLDPVQLDTLHLKATILIDMGEEEAAKLVLQRAVEAEPDKGAEKYIALAQLSEGEEAAAHFAKALHILQASTTSSITEEEREIWRRQVAAVYCSLAELYMTDLCLQPEAESKCEDCVQAALETSPDDYETYQTMANMKMSQNKTEEAVEAISRSLELWTVLPFDHPDYPSYEFRLTAARLLVEMRSLDVAQCILESLVVEDDEILEVWYLLALALYSMEKKSAANEALLNAEKLSSRGCPPEIADAISELREALGVSTLYDNTEPEDGDEDGELADQDIMDVDEIESLSE